MTDRERQINEYVYRRDHYSCFRCGIPATQIAHVIPNTKVKNKKWGKDVIMHAMNKKASCQDCNSYAMKGVKGLLEEELVHTIQRQIDKEKRNG